MDKMEISAAVQKAISEEYDVMAQNLAERLSEAVSVNFNDLNENLVATMYSELEQTLKPAILRQLY
ncbi:hypothetical protein [Bombilactobacillus thymidiniphilus]|uniref:Uncharacterized protein n=1 Tax=Bombilactobacillus thymidiniphilus TaxID=2923363 RepID=A0ABY4PBT9_9LACO|nr:hypothetical protein [Bombilactobacillus thymidiniphilus]UQS83002.1 hypothetical protein MOO47_04260 [Bombilactobacillus thymidiniphilus]